MSTSIEKKTSMWLIKYSHNKKKQYEREREREGRKILKMRNFEKKRKGMKEKIKMINI